MLMFCDHFGLIELAVEDEHAAIIIDQWLISPAMSPGDGESCGTRGMKFIGLRSDVVRSAKIKSLQHGGACGIHLSGWPGFSRVEDACNSTHVLRFSGR